MSDKNDKPSMIEIYSNSETLADGTRLTMTVSTADGAQLSPEDRAFISRFVPLAAGSVVDKLEG